MTNLVCEVSVTEVRPVRHAVLRPGQPAERLIYPGDDEALHFGIHHDDTLVAVASFYQEPIPNTTTPAWRIRGMATLLEHRARGHGRRLVEAGLQRIREKNSAPVWCNARTTAAGYYKLLGFKPRGDEFEIPDIGPHFVMVLDAANS